MEHPIVAYHIPTRAKGSPDMPHIDDALAKYNRPEMLIAISDFGMDPVVSRGIDSYDIISGIAAVLRPTLKRDGHGDWQVHVVPDRIGTASISAFRTTTPLPISEVIDGIPQLNHRDVKKLANKSPANRLLARLGLGKGYVDLANYDNDFGQALLGADFDHLVIKPEDGKQSSNIHIGTKPELLKAINSGEIDTTMTWVIEEELDTTGSLPGLRGENDEQQRLLDAANSNNVPKELRIYTFGRQNGVLAEEGVVRAAGKDERKLGNDKWIFVDQESLPDEVLLKTEKIEAIFREESGQPEIHIAVDWVFANVAGKGKIWVPMEVNGREPEFVRIASNPELAKRLIDKLAAQLYRMSHGRVDQD